MELSEICGTAGPVVLVLIIRRLSVDAVSNFYKNRICKNSCYQAEVGGSPQLKLMPHIFKRPVDDVVSNIYKNRICKKS